MHLWLLHRINKEFITELVEERERNELLKQSLIFGAETYSNQEATDLCKAGQIYDGYGREIQFNKKSQLILKLNSAKNVKFLSKIIKRIPDWQRLDIDSIPGEDKEVKIFLHLYFPNKVKWFYFNDKSCLSPFLSFYMRELETLSPRIGQRFWICNFEVSQHQMGVLLAANKDKKSLGFISCKLDLSSVPQFGGALQGSTIEGLDLNGWGLSELGDWENNPSHFENLIEGLAKEQDFKNNLKMIVLWGCGMEKSQIEEILKKHLFEEVEILM